MQLSVNRSLNVGRPLQIGAASLGLILLSACSSSSGTSPVTTETTSGKATITYLPFDATNGIITPTTAAPDPTNGPTIQAVLANGTVMPGKFDATTGAYSIPSIPIATGYYWLKDGTNYIWTDQTAVDLSHTVAGRGATAAVQNNTVTYNLTGLFAWGTESNYGTDDYLNLYDYNSNNLLSRIQGTMSGTTFTADASAHLDWYGHNLIDTTKGDAPALVQYESTYIQGITGDATERLYEASYAVWPTPVTMVDGTDTAFAGAASAINTATAKVNLNYTRSQFAQFTSSCNPDESMYPPVIEIDAVPGAKTYGALGGQWLTEVSTYSTGSVMTDFNQAVAVPVPPTGFDQVVWAGQHSAITFDAPGTRSNTPVYLMHMATFSTTLPTSTAPLKMLVSPVINPMIGIQSAYAGSEASGGKPLIAAVGLTPSVSWAAPALGTPTAYQLGVFQVIFSDSDSSVNDYTQVATLTLDGSQTSTTLPAGILSTGRYYFMVISAYAGAGSPKTAPFAGKTFPFGVAQVATCLMTPGDPAILNSDY
ncbi:MAG: hypothetical protein P4L36_10810 [Holophaga sp.]|nr:hypothetical protein [Holophaga sp.]